MNFTGHPAFEGGHVNKVLKGKKVVCDIWQGAARADENLMATLNAMGMPLVRSKKKKKQQMRLSV